ncbi:hypothetical protein ThidrDRAFT_2778 [Thiorhodococcus drewsii AZ1]|uniref:DUF4214 domain-containing protein n=1 Tax=Thiorhodococcus drewsii AZ1 TaxID=765913 RepID=G2E3B5_9GAMM|nr:DUF4214 domain-containing protein [Thiorhodococcus drewsii]EGV30304.1 hypothetical protein ThidrDRAFT_2778 [Thiorhodococcus drewsii AZ1]
MLEKKSLYFVAVSVSLLIFSSSICAFNPISTKTTESIPSQFSEAYLAGKTFYLVWFGSGEDESGNELDDVPAALEVQLQANGTAVISGLLNSGDTTATWAVDDTGLLYFDGDATEGNLIACNHTDEFIRTHYMYENEVDNVDLYFFDRQEALDYASSMTQAPEPCAQGPGFATLPSAAIQVDGLTDDWSDIEPVITDPADDQEGSSATDIRAVYAAIDEEAERMGFLMQVEGTIQMPHTPSQEYSHYHLSFNYHWDQFCQVEDKIYIYNDYATADGERTTVVSPYDPTQDLDIDYPVESAYQGSALEASFDLDILPVGVRSVSLYAHPASSPNYTPLDEANSGCYLLPFERILELQRDDSWLVTEIYTATLGYAPDNEGLQYWVANLQNGGWTPTEVAQSFFDAPLVQEMYPTDQGYGPFIEALYENLFGRAPDAEGYQYWLAELDSGRVQRNQMIIALIEGGWANADATSDMARFGHRIQVGLAFAAEQAERGIVYSQLSEDQQVMLRQIGREVLATVTDDSATRKAAIDNIPSLLDQL